MTKHVWHQGQKVTGLSDSHRGRYVWGYGYMPLPSGPEFRRQRANYFRRHAPPTIGDAAWRVLTVAGSHLGWFRLVDEHGKPYGRRLQRLGPTRDSGHWYQRWDYLVADQYGNEQWLDGATRVRHVAQQPEDYHSYASRVLTRAHKQED